MASVSEAFIVSGWDASASRTLSRPSNCMAGGAPGSASQWRSSVSPAGVMLYQVRVRRPVVSVRACTRPSWASRLGSE
jgi:hypothetical protein